MQRCHSRFAWVARPAGLFQLARLAWCLSCFGLFACLSGGGASAAQASGPAASDACAGVQADDVLRQLNALRAAGGRCGAMQLVPGAALAWQPQLALLAAEQAQWLAESGTLSHRGRGGLTLAQRAQRGGYAYARIDENVALGQVGVAAVLADWQASPGHCINLHDSRVSEAALACSRGAGGLTYWALLLGRPGARPSGPGAAAAEPGP